MESIIERQREIVTRHIRGENEHDWPSVYDTCSGRQGLLRCCAPGYEVQRNRGRARILSVDRKCAFPICTSRSLQNQVPECSIREVVITGTREIDFAGVKPLGNKVRIETAAFYSFDPAAGKLISERIYTIKPAPRRKCKVSKLRR